ncbi:hypothetical protein PC116_g20414 [Phytophthora cactorum]|uniref:Uncharacterized protein n=1 Tax=Phytophthora cactorum TaxID=29920 RepID=A0A8T1BH93_9STRA|nr:hypothetical protein Pcac1_g5174 [Phytophthora cactorum]KAG2805267.1 hypothetical protein PC112_g18341 [Phytophthora cactorum]KAG2806688.1 hypothetical protein PC111_g17258 [Phytophthora cactorum]KAG2849904.1 hypothetical protein PC113_g17277 [Phytophthora cactorum]KAG2879654.1 hypothetical protein PC114_g22457 [Phytophthora cactorum]
MVISSFLKVTSALRQLSYASTSDALDENLEMSETSVLSVTSTSSTTHLSYDTKNTHAC